MYAPRITSARRVREHQLGPSHTALLLTDVRAYSTIKYTHLLVISANGRQDPIASISSEVKDYPILIQEKYGLSDLDVAKAKNAGSHFLCAFTADGHLNFGASDDWADLEKFEQAALEHANRLLSTERA